MSLADAFNRLREQKAVSPTIRGDVSARILVVDIETTPSTAQVWGAFDQNVGLNQITEVGGLLCFAAKWYGEDDTVFAADWTHGHEGMVRLAWDLLDEADYVVGYNSIQFDMKHLNREFVLAGLPAPSPYRNVDLLRVVRKQFRFFSNKLDFVAGQLGLGHKVAHEGHGLWKACMDGDRTAQLRMEDYNREDVRLTEDLFDRLRPWLGNVLNLGLHSSVDGPACPSCGGGAFESAGVLETGVTRFSAVRCVSCGALSRALEAVKRVRERAV